MPIPKPKSDESEQDFVSRCVRQLKSENPDAGQAQVLAICFDVFRKSKEAGEKMEADIKNSKDEVKLDEDGHIIVAENVSVRFETGMFIKEGVEDEEN